MSILHIYTVYMGQVYSAPCQCPQCESNLKVTYHILDDLILAILSLDLQQVVAEIKEVEAPLLAQQNDDGAASPV